MNALVDLAPHDFARIESMLKLQKRVDDLCAKLDAGDPQRASCEGMLRTSYRASKAASSS